MGTRSIIMVKKNDSQGKPVVKRLYKHYDGYPTDNLKMIAQAILKSKTLLGFIANCEEYYRPNMIEASFKNSKFKPEMLGNQGDLEWIYTVDLDAKQVKVFGGGYTGKAPQIAYKKGVVDPVSYVKALYKEYQAKEREQILASIFEIKSLGFSLNGAKNE